jgi:dihydroxyacetone kinase-like protein
MIRVANCLEKVFSPDNPDCCKDLFQQAGWGTLSADGGASTSLLGTFLLGVADGCGSEASAFDARQLAASFQSGLTALQKQTKAMPGDKTLMDAMVPAVGEMVAAAENGESVEYALRKAADAAKVGADTTRNLTARYGRAKLQGERTKGHADPGATSVALLFEGFHQGFTEADKS